MSRPAPRLRRPRCRRHTDRVRLNRTGVVAGLIYLVFGLSWLAVSGQRWWWGAAWFVAVAIAGAFLPGPANQVSLARAYLAAPALAYSLAPGGLGPLAVTMSIAALSDLVDGTVARRFASPSAFGGALDPVVDGVFLSAVVVGLTIGGSIPAWLALVVIGRYLLPALVGGALLLARRPVQLRHTLTGQVSTTLILVLVGGVVLLRGLNQDPGNLVIGAEVVIPVVTLATFVHLGLALGRPAAAPGHA